MFKLFGSRKAKNADAAAAPAPSPVPTQQTQAQARTDATPRLEAAPLTRQGAAQIRAQAQRRKDQATPPESRIPGQPTTPRQMVRAAKKRRLRFNETAHLYANHAIPMWVFHKALPQRFAQMAARHGGGGDEFVFQ